MLPSRAIALNAQRPFLWVWIPCKRSSYHLYTSQMTPASFVSTGTKNLMLMICITRFYMGSTLLYAHQNANGERLNYIVRHWRYTWNSFMVFLSVLPTENGRQVNSVSSVFKMLQTHCSEPGNFSADTNIHLDRWDYNYCPKTRSPQLKTDNNEWVSICVCGAVVKRVEISLSDCCLKSA